MINILLSLYNFDEPWCFDILKNIINKNHKVLIIPFSYDDKWLRNEYDWYNYFNKINGTHYKDIVYPFLSYGIEENNIEWVNHFIQDTNEMKYKINNVDIIFFTGGYPDKMMDKFRKYDLINELENFNKIMIGSSAGAMVQISEYLITPDCDYDKFSYNKGLNLIKNFDILVHFENTEIQNIGILKNIREKEKPVYSIPNDGGLVVINNEVIPLGTTIKWPYYIV